LPQGSGEHLFLWIEKSGLNTQDVARRLAQVSGSKPRDIGFAGMKDRNAVTRQWFSLVSREETPLAWDLGHDCRILEANRHKNKLRTGHLLGNRFRITLLDLPADHLARARLIADQLADHGFVNYFGPQRFGREGRNLNTAQTWLSSADSSHEDARDARAGKRRGRKDSRFDSKLLSSVLQSEIFNRYTHRRLTDDRELLLGEVVRLEGTGSHFVVEDLQAELQRYRAGDLHRTGPMIGPKGLQAKDDARSLEEEIVAECGLDEAALIALGRHAPGTRRDLLLRAEGLTLAPERDGRLVVEFVLPAGAYATVLVREFTGAPWDAPRKTSESTFGPTETAPSISTGQ
jgi:tRNA pseudouridine13 synthase